MKSVTIDEINEMWAKDSCIDIGNLAVEVIKIDELHFKYYKIYFRELKLFQSLEKTLPVLKRLKADWYTGIISDEELNEQGWERRLHITKSKVELENYIQADKDLIRANLILAEQKEKIEYLKDIIRTIGFRGNRIKTAVEALKFQEGIY